MSYFKYSTEGDHNVGMLAYSFKSGRYWDIVKAMFWRDLLLFLWFLLLIVPGIIKTISHSMVPFILSDNPNIGMRRATELSNQMTGGHKWKIFVLYLSFLGWILLGLLACGIGTLFVLPYMNATQAELYTTLRQQAIYAGMTSHYELRMQPPSHV